MIAGVICAIVVLYMAIPTFGYSPMTGYRIPGDSWFKAYMDYRKITSVSSRQYKLQETATTDRNGIRTVKGRYCVAVGTGFKAPVGTKLKVVLDSGVTLRCIVGDIKSDVDTDETYHIFAKHDNVVEFIVDEDKLADDPRIRGDISWIPGFSGRVDRLYVEIDDDPYWN